MKTTEAKTRHEYWKHEVRCYWTAAYVADHALEEIATALVEAEEGGTPSCVWHEVYSWVWNNIPRNKCSICGGDGGSLREGQDHELCRLRRKRGVATPPVNKKWDCACAKCRREVAHA